MEAIDIQKIKDDTAIENGYTGWVNCLCETFQLGNFNDMLKVTDKVISEVAKQVAERQREMCKKKAKIKIVAHYEKLPKDTKSLPFTSRLGSSWKCYIDQKSILNAPIPEIK